MTLLGAEAYFNEGMRIVQSFSFGELQRNASKVYATDCENNG